MTSNRRAIIGGIVAPILLAGVGVALNESTAPSRGYFEGSLILRDVAALHIDDANWTEFELVDDYTYIDRSGRRWTVPAGHVVNGASIPQLVWSWLGGPWSGRYRNASVIHDYMCHELVESSRFTHRLFFEILVESGVKRRKSQIMYGAVKRFGPRWKKGSGFLPPRVLESAEIDPAEFDLLVEQLGSADLTVDEIDALLDDVEED